jgi:hypothetical protein
MPNVTCASTVDPAISNIAAKMVVPISFFM